MRFVPYGDPDRFTHRLEAFSDIVIGFSLAQLSLSLTIPPHVTDVVYKPFGFFAFLITFAIICMLWLRHHKWFEHYFVPTPLNVVLNFAVLGAIVLLVYALQLFLHSMRLGISFWPSFCLYMGTFGIVLLLFGIVYLIGVLRPRRDMTDDVRIVGFVQALRLVGAAVGVAIGVLIGTDMGAPSWGMLIVVGFIIVGAAVGRGAGNVIGKRTVNA